jgi:hypothetical protein
MLAETGGFLLGNAHRCGVSVERLDAAGMPYRATHMPRPITGAALGELPRHYLNGCLARMPSWKRGSVNLTRLGT